MRRVLTSLRLGKVKRSLQKALYVGDSGGLLRRDGWRGVNVWPPDVVSGGFVFLKM